MSITITADLFEAFLKCPTKCYLRSLGETRTENTYADWFRTQSVSYHNDGIRRLIEGIPEDERVTGVAATVSLRAAKWSLAVDFVARAQNLESVLHAVERVPSKEQGQPTQFIPIRFIFANKLTIQDKLLVAFDALILSEILGSEVLYGKVIHGDDHIALTVKTSGLTCEVRKLVGKIGTLLSASSAPDLILNRHCAECKFQARCRQKAIEADDLSLLSGMTEKERSRHCSKGIFTVTHLSYTFRPRRKPKRLAGKSEKYHHSLKALAIREGKVHVVGAGELKVTGTPIYIDVEGLPDRDFYYLIGLRMGTGGAAVQHSLWADTVQYEKKIWHQFVDILSAIQDPVIVHYGRFEANFFRQMRDRYGTTLQAFTKPINLLSFIFARIYFPTYSNALKDIAGYLGLRWSVEDPSGIKTIIWRSEWERSNEASLKEKLVTYNAEDCEALSRVTEYVREISSGEDRATENVVLADSLPRESFLKFGRTHYLLPAFEEINRAAYWDYQREKIILRSDKRLKKITGVSHRKKSGRMKTNCVTHWPGPRACPQCGGSKLYQRERSTKQVVDIKFGGSSIERWVTTYIFHRYRCPACHAFFANPDHPWAAEKYGRDLLSLCTYLNIELDVPQRKIGTFLREILGFRFLPNTVHTFKTKVASLYKPTYESLLRKIIGGRLIHADETKINLLHGGTGYVWVFASLENVAYVYAPSREGQLAQTLLKDFKGVLVTDFYAAYESIDCPQQKCLLHLIRDLNDELMKEPFNDELKGLVRAFADLVKPMIETVDRFGLRTLFLRKHKIEVEKFFNDLSLNVYRTESAEKCKRRFEKNRDGLFTFLDYDGVPWNNNNAEHAIKAVARLRENLGSLCTQTAIEDYLIILSVSETCRFKGVNFLEFLRSGEGDIDTYIDSRIKRYTMRERVDRPEMKGRRRKFTTAYKLRIVKKLRNCPRNQVGAILRQERLDWWCVRRWQRQVAQVLELAGQGSQSPNLYPLQDSSQSEESQEQRGELAELAKREDPV